MRISQNFQKTTATGLMILFLLLAIVPISMLMAKFVTGGHFVQLCTSTGMQTVWVADDDQRVGGVKPSSNMSNSSVSAESKMLSPFGCCEFCWTSVLTATLIPLLIVLFIGRVTAQFSIPESLNRSFQSYLRHWHVSPRAPPIFSI